MPWNMLVSTWFRVEKKIDLHCQQEFRSWSSRRIVHSFIEQKRIFMHVIYKWITIPFVSSDICYFFCTLIIIVYYKNLLSYKYLEFFRKHVHKLQIGSSVNTFSPLLIRSSIMEYLGEYAFGTSEIYRSFNRLNLTQNKKQVAD